MKGILTSPLLLWPVLACAALSPLAAAPPEVRDLLRDGLYKEEVNRDPEGAAKAYQELLTRNDELRAFAATAQFRLAEVRRKQGRKEEAIAAYRLVLTRYPESETECRLARENLVTLGAPFQPEGATPAAGKGALLEDGPLLEQLRTLAKSKPDELSGYFQQTMDYGCMNSLAFLLENAQPPQDRSLLEMARGSGSLEAVELLLKHGVDARSYGARMALIQAVEANQIFILKAMLQGGLDVNAANFGNGSPEQDPDLRTPLIAAIRKDNLPMVELLLAAKADVNRPVPPTGLTPLHQAVVKRNLEMIKLLLAAGADVNAVTEPMEMPRSARPNDQNLDLSHGGSLSLSPLDIALWGDEMKIIETLQKAGGKSHDGGIVTLAVLAGDEEGVRLMFDRGVDGSRALVPARPIPLLKDHPQVVQLLAEHGVKFGNERLGELLYNGKPELVKTLLEHHCDLPGALQSEDVLKMAQRGEIIHLVVDHGGAVTSQMVDAAARNGQAGELRYLLEHGGKATPLKGDQTTLLNVTPEIAAILLEHDAEQIIGSRGQMIFDQALKDGKTGLAGAILRSKVKPKIGPGQIRDAARSPDLTLLELLLDEGGLPDDYWRKQGFPDDGNPANNLKPGARAMLFRKLVLPGMKESPDVRWISTGETWEPFQKLATDTLESRSPSAKPRPLAERLHGRYSTGHSANPTLPSLPECLAVWRKSAAGEWQKTEVHLKDDAPYPELEWGDIVDATGPEQANPPGLTSGEIRIAAASHIAFPLTIEMDGVARDLQVNGKRFTVDPTVDEIPVMTLGRLTELFSRVKFEHRAGEKVTVLRKDWPPITLDSSSRAANFELTSGDRVIWETKADSYREQLVCVTSPGLPYQTAISLRSAGGDSAKAPAPTLLQTIAETYNYPWEAGEILTHPDFSRLRVRRLKDGNPGEEMLDINLQAGIDALPAGFTREQAQKLDVPLRAGDVLEIPVLEHSRDQAWNGFSPALSEVLRKTLSCAVQISNANNEIEVRNFTYEPAVYRSGPNGIEAHAPATGSSSLRLSDLLGDRRTYRAATADGQQQITADAGSLLISDQLTYVEVPRR